MLRVAKSAALNSLLHVPRQSHEAKYLFKSSRTRLSIEKIHLPPDLGKEDAKVDKKKGDTKRDTDKQTNHRRLHHSHDYEKGELIFSFV